MKRAFLPLLLASGCALAGGDIKGLLPGTPLDHAGDFLGPLTCKPSMGGARRYFDTYCDGATSYGGEIADVSVFSFDKTAGKITVRGDVANWPTVRSGLIAKYGKPQSIEASIVTTLAGARLTSETLRWTIDGFSIEGTKLIDATHYGVASSSPEFDAEHARRMAKSKSDM